ncbi:MAG TPA: hypothetical protein DCP06_04990 [Lachnospiraceae bacterium]|nr:hypothetical protein [Lachnospiraceae bacterium]
MGIGPVSGIGGLFPMYSAMPVTPVRGVDAASPRSDGVAAAVVGVGSLTGAAKPGSVDNTGHRIGSNGEPEPTKQDKRVGKAECETCKNRKYVDGSNEGDVSFKAPSHIDPSAAPARVMGHEMEHVANARQEDAKENKELVSVSVTLHTSICPECGRVYVSGGETNTTMRTSHGGDDKNSAAKQMLNGYKGIQNPYEREMNKQLAMHGAGLNFSVGA